MIQKKICLLGAFAVGKTSLVSRFVDSRFNERYHTTVGVKIDRKTVTVNDEEVRLLLWDMTGEDKFIKVEMSYLRGAAGYLLVVDGTRESTLQQACDLHERVQKSIGPVPFALLINKFDLKDEWEIDETTLQQVAAIGWPFFRTSARTGDDVERAFLALTEMILQPK